MSGFERYEDPRRRELIRALASGAFMLGVPGAGALAAEAFGSRPAKLPPNQSIYRMSGTVTVNGAPATMQTLVASKDTIETGSNSEVVFVVGENAFILRSDSRMTLEPDKRSALASVLNLVAGKLLAVFPPGKTQTQIRTPVSTMGIRGTGVYIESDPEQTYFCTCYGVADVTSNTDPGEQGHGRYPVSRQAALHRRQRTGGAGDPRRTLHQSYRPGIDAHRNAGRPHRSLRLPQGHLPGAAPRVLTRHCGAPFRIQLRKQIVVGACGRARRRGRY